MVAMLVFKIIYLNIMIMTNDVMPGLSINEFACVKSVHQSRL